VLWIHELTWKQAETTGRDCEHLEELIVSQPYWCRRLVMDRCMNLGVIMLQSSVELLASIDSQ